MERCFFSRLDLVEEDWTASGEIGNLELREPKPLSPRPYRAAQGNLPCKGGVSSIRCHGFFSVDCRKKGNPDRIIPIERILHLRRRVVEEIAAISIRSHGFLNGTDSKCEDCRRSCALRSSTDSELFEGSLGLSDHVFVDVHRDGEERRGEDAEVVRQADPG